MPSGPNRRRLLLGGAAPSGAAAIAGQASVKAADLPRFLWGAVGASCQIEGGNYASDLSPGDFLGAQNYTYGIVGADSGLPQRSGAS
jgi:hypothetical protein